MLSDRQKRILKLIVEEYVKSIEPVGSKFIAGNPNFDYSSATIRNDMAVLEEQGYLLKTYTSSGRVPSEKGYKMYVEMMMEEKEQANDQERFPMIDEIFERNNLSRDQAIKESMSLVSELTNYASIVLGSSGYKARIRKVQLVRLDKNCAVMILVTNQGYVESKKIYIPEEIDPHDLEVVISLLNEALYDCPISEIDSQIRLYLETKEIYRRAEYYDALIGVFIRAITSMSQDKYYLQGQSNIMKQPEFQDIEKLSNIMRAMDEKEIFKLVKITDDNITVRIGNENEVSAMKDCTVITVPYSDRDGYRGALAVVGPKRMEYSKVIPLLEYIAKYMKNI